MKNSFQNVLLFAFLLFQSYFTHSSAKRCPIGNCNNAGTCSVDNNHVKCACIDGYFSGEQCKELQNACDQNPCENAATCEPGFGQFLCKCTGTWGGQRCNANKPTFTKMHILHNPIGVYGEKHNFLLTVESLGAVGFGYKTYTNNCLIDTFEWYAKHSNDVFTYSRDLRAVARSYGLWHAARIPYKAGYYHSYYESFWEAGTLKVKVRVADMESSALYEQPFNIYIVQPSKVPCIPDIGFMHGSNPEEPLMVDIARFNVFNAIIHKHCALNSRMDMHWTVHDSTGNIQLHNFGNNGKRQLKVKPYRLWFKHQGAVTQSYMIRVNVDERFGRTVIHKKVRCYIFVLSKPVSAQILGGRAREVGARQSFHLDGSHSRDFGLSPLVEQKMKFKWGCESSDDSSNRNCRANMGTGNILYIPAGILHVGKSYTFSLLATSYVSTKEQSTAKQTIHITSEPKHYVYIECVRNCDMNYFATGRKIHLLMRCPTCSAKPNITWKIGTGGSSTPTNAYRIGFMPPTSGSVTTEVTLASGTRSGKSSIELEHNAAPKGGKCTIKPTSGVEYETEFHIECNGFDDPNGPLFYQYIAENFTFDRTNECLMSTRLPKTSSLRVLVCDSLHACTDSRVSVSVSAMQAPQDVEALKELLAKPQTNIKNLLEDGDIEKAMVLVDVLTRNTRTLAMAELIYAQLSGFRLETLLHVEQLTKVTRDLMAALQPLDHKRVSLFTKYFRKISTGFYHIIVDREFQELRAEPYDILYNEVVEMIAEFSAQLEDMPPVVRIEPPNLGSTNRLSERYAPVPVFDETLLTRIENWLDVIFESFRCLHFVGIAGTIMHEPSDDHYKLDKPGVKVDVFSIEGMKRLNLETPNRKIEIIVPSNMLAELESMLHSAQLLFQVISFERNPFWWYPDTEALSTGIVAFSVYSANDPLREDTYLKHPIEFHMSLSHTAPTSPAPGPHLVEGYVNDTHDMPIYRFEMPVNTAAIVKFSHPTTRLRIKLNLCTKPRSFQVRASADIVPEKDTFHIVNDKGGDAWAYLAVMAADEISARETFKFETTMLKCLVWDFKMRDPAWSTASCVPKLEASNAQNLTCSCYHLSTYAGKKHTTSASESDTPRRVLTHLLLNGYMLLFFLFLILLFTLLFWWAWYSLQHHKGDLIICLEQEDIDSEFGVNVHITTGSQWDATSTANVTLMFALPHGVRKFVIQQNQADPHLVRTSTCTLRLPLSGDDLAQPLLLSIRRDNCGRYPSWYCRNIVVEDYANELICTFEVEQWIRTKPLVLDAAYFREGPQSRMRIFRQTLESLCIQWFLFQPLVGPWKYGDMALNRFERTCIWSVKLALLICIVACYMGPTTLKTYEADREKYRNIIYDWTEICFLCIFSYVLCFFAEMGLKAFIYHDELRTQKRVEDEEE